MRRQRVAAAAPTGSKTWKIGAFRYAHMTGTRM
jgi:hypothetical protein